MCCLPFFGRAAAAWCKRFLISHLFARGVLAVGVAMAGLFAFVLPTPVRAQLPKLTPELQQELLILYPAADTNQDGALSESEAISYYLSMRGRRSQSALPGPAPTMANIPYGPHARHVLDFWQAPAATSANPAPVVVYIHGGGFVNGDKTAIRGDRLIQACLDAGVSFAAINYRYLSPSVPLQDILRDCARAVQFLRVRAMPWSIDTTRIAAYGASAGAGASIWLAAHPDLADPANADMILRESSRVVAAGGIVPQATYDLVRWTEIFGAEPVQRFGGRYNSPGIYGLATMNDLRTPAGEKIRADVDMLSLLSKDTAPIFISGTFPTLAVENLNQLLHHPRHAQLLYERLRELGVPTVANIPALKITPAAGEPRTWPEFLFQHLGVKTGRAR